MYFEQEDQGNTFSELNPDVFCLSKHLKTINKILPVDFCVKLCVCVLLKLLRCFVLIVLCYCLCDFWWNILFSSYPLLMLFISHCLTLTSFDVFVAAVITANQQQIHWKVKFSVVTCSFAFLHTHTYTHKNFCTLHSSSFILSRPLLLVLRCCCCWCSVHINHFLFILFVLISTLVQCPSVWPFHHLKCLLVCPFVLSFSVGVCVCVCENEDSLRQIKLTKHRELFHSLFALFFFLPFHFPELLLLLLFGRSFVCSRNCSTSHQLAENVPTKGLTSFSSVLSGV